MRTMRKEVAVEIHDQAWSDSLVDAGDRRDSERELNPLIGISVAIALGMASWIVILQVYFLVIQ